MVDVPVCSTPFFILLNHNDVFFPFDGQALVTELQVRAEILSQLEDRAQALSQFISSGESARIKARLTQTGRYWEELKESMEHLNGQLKESSGHQQKFNTNLQQVGLCKIFIVVYHEKSISRSI